MTTLLMDSQRPAAASLRSEMAAGPLLSVRHLVTEFKTHGGPLRAVNDVSFELAPGRVLAVLGESGSGKSAMLRTMLGSATARRASAARWFCAVLICSLSRLRNGNRCAEAGYR